MKKWTLVATRYFELELPDHIKDRYDVIKHFEWIENETKFLIDEDIQIFKGEML